MYERPRLVVDVDDNVLAQMVETARSGDRKNVGRLLTLVEQGGNLADSVSAATYHLTTGAHIIGITGAPGSGKSTLTAGLATDLARMGKQPAVLAVDPSSPLTGGAILGDRVRMEAASVAGAFIRSMATRGHAGGLALAVPGMVRVLDACSFDPIIVETVGVGQVEVDVASATDTVIVVVTAGWGDAVQANKAGLLEIADMFVVNKSDRPGADDARRDLELMLDLSEVTGQTVIRPEIVMTTATENIGIEELWLSIEKCYDHLISEDRLTKRHERRHRAEIRSHLEYLLTVSVEEKIADLTPSLAEIPVVIAKRLALEILTR